MYQEIMKCKKKGYLKSEVSRKLGLDPGTVAKYYRMSESEYREYARLHMYRDKAFDRYRADILEVYERNGCQRLQVASVYDYLEERHGELPGTEKTLRNYIKYLRETGQLEFKEHIRCYQKVPELPMGKQLQLDFGEYTTPHGLKLYIFASVLSASRYKYAAFQDKPFTTLDLIGHLLDCFDYIGGVVEELVIDQDKVMVVSENHGDIIYTRDFLYFIEEMGLRMYVCRKADPESKGKVESSVKYVKYNFLGTRGFETLEEAKESLLRWLTRRANGKISQATKRIPLEAIEEEREHLQLIRNSIYRKESLLGREERSADENCLISVSASQYSVPARYRNKQVEIYRTEGKVFIFDGHTGEQIAEHAVAVVPGGRVINKDHYRRNGMATAVLKEEVLNRFSLEKWHLFVQHNFNTYHRYVRDQCLEAKRHFGEEVDLEQLDRALGFCLELKTYSMANLADTYRYYKGLSETKEDDILAEMVPQLKEVSRQRKAIRVSKRDLGVYTSLISIVTGVLS
ncbi:MAG: IS21 family transposase [Candidatus Thorarchaeota archaeon]|jgi:transposase